MELRAFLDSRRPVDIESTDPAFLRTWFIERVDFAPPAVTAHVDDAALIGGRLCLFLARRVASYMYRAGGHVISLYVMKEDGLTTPASPVVRVGGREVTLQRTGAFGHMTWREGGLLYSLVSDLPQAHLLEFAGGLSI